MASLAGLKILKRNTGFSTRLKIVDCYNSYRDVDHVPQKIVYYSRFTNQLNFLRSNDYSYLKRLFRENSKTSQYKTDLIRNSSFRADNLLGKELENFEASGSFNGRDDDDDDDDDAENDREPISADIDKLKDDKAHRGRKNFKFFFSDEFEYRENDYIYRHVHKTLDRFASLGDQLPKLPVHNSVNQLIELCDTKKKMIRQIEIDHDLKFNTPNYDYYRIINRNFPRDLKSSISDLVNVISKSISTLNQQELAILLTAIKGYNDVEFIEIKKRIDLELRWLLKKNIHTRLSDLDLWLYLSDVFYECLFKSTFVYVLVNYIVENPDFEITNRQFLHILFLVILERQQNRILNVYENKIFNMIENASFEDIALICMAYFKTRTRIRNKYILEKIIDKTTECLPTIEPKEPAYCSVLKAVRYSRLMDCRNNVLNLVSTLSQDKDSKIILTSIYNTVHTLKLLESYRISYPQLLNMMYDAVLYSEDDQRIKDVQYALTSLSNLCYQDLKLNKRLKKDFDLIVQDITSNKKYDIQYQYLHVMPLFRAFVMFKYYNVNFINHINSLMNDSKHIHNMKKAHEFVKSYLVTYVATRLECKTKIDDFNLEELKKCSESIERYGNLGSAKRDFTSLKYLDFILQTNVNSNFTNSNAYRKVTKNLVSHKLLQDPSYNFNFQYTFPHQNFADLVVSRNSAEPGSFDNETLLPKKVPKNEKHCILLSMTKFDYVDGISKPSGFKNLIERLMKQLGYTVITFDLDNHDLDYLATQIQSTLSVNDQILNGSHSTVIKK